MVLLNLFTHLGATLGSACNVSGGEFFRLPKWYKYLDGQWTISGDPAGGALVCAPKLAHLSDVWLIVLAVIDILLRIAVLVAVAFVVYGGVQYMTSQGDPGNTKQARSTILNALIGVLIAVSAATVVSYLAGRFT